MQEYQNGTSPGQFDTPAAPPNFVVTTDASGTYAKLSWATTGGPVTGYTIERGSDNSTVAQGSSSRSYVDSVSTLPTEVYYDYQIPNYRLRAEYASGSSGWTAWQAVTDLTAPTTSILPAQNGSAHVFVSAIPAYATSVRVGQVAYDYINFEEYLEDSIDIPVSQFTNGLAALPAAFLVAASNNWLSVQFVLTNTADGAVSYNGYQQVFWDGRAQLKDNLRFQLRFPPLYDGDIYSDPLAVEVHSLTDVTWESTPPPPAYAYASYRSIQEFGGAIQQPVDVQLPFADNWFYHHFAYAATNVDSFGGLLMPWFDWSPWGIEVYLTNAFQFVPPVSGNTLPSLLDTNAARWLAFSNPDDYHQPSTFGQLSDWINEAETAFGVSTEALTTNYQLTMTSVTRNWFGLPYQSFLLAQDNGAEVLSPTHPVLADSGYFYPEVAQPAFQLESYYFSRIKNDDEFANPPLPGYSYFDPTNTTPSLFLTSVGATDFKLAGYAKLAVTNGYAGVYGYLGQYFDRAYTTTNGVMTTNETGILSPYGEFFPTEPGRTALLTLPDLETNERGTAIVHVVKLQLDVNHDGVMDLSFAGPDNTSQTKPFVFWVNDDRDITKDIGDWGQDVESLHSYLYDYKFPIVRSVRDLEDFARLWICGIPVLATNMGYQVTLSWNVSSGNPAINLFRAVEADGGIGYLTDTNVGLAQIASATPAAPGWTIGAVTAAAPFTFPSHYFTNGNTRNLLFEGAGIGAGELVLTISQGTNLLAQTSTWLDLRDVKDMVEWAHAENVTSLFPPSSLESQFKLDQPPAVTVGSAKQIVVFVHGINNSQFAYENTTATTFKRLYWSGYQGQVAGFRWPCAYLPKENSIDPTEYLKSLNYNKGEFYAWKSANAFKLYLHNLTNRLAGYQVNILAHSQGSVVVSEAIKQGAPFDNLILSQAAISAHCYDTSTNVPFMQKFLIAETNTPTPFYHTNGGYHGYCESLSGNIINFFNPQDFALVTGTFLGSQANWERNHEVLKPANLLWVLGPTYSYSAASAISYRTDYTPQGTVIVPVTDTHEIKALVARTRSKAVGALAGVQGSVDSAVDLQASYGIGTTRNEHSAQFTRPIQSVIIYYQAIRVQISP